jgi:hypothetical protein
MPNFTKKSGMTFAKKGTYGVPEVAGTEVNRRSGNLKGLSRYLQTFPTRWSKHNNLSHLVDLIQNRRWERGDYVWRSLSTKISLTKKKGEIYGQKWMGRRSTTSWEERRKRGGRRGNEKWVGECGWRWPYKISGTVILWRTPNWCAAE